MSLRTSLSGAIGLLVAFLVVSATARIMGQTSPADGPWTGEALCVLSTQGPNYREDQTHRWRLTGEPPRVTGSVRHWPAVWSVQGSGRSASESWTINVPETSAPVAIYEIQGPRGSNTLRIESQHGQLTFAGAINLLRSSGARLAVPLWEWTFPKINGAATSTTLSGSSPSRTIVTTYAWQAPSTATATETCTFNFVRGAPPGSPQSLQSAATASTTSGSQSVAIGVAGVKPPVLEIATDSPTGGVAAARPVAGATIEGTTTTTLSRTGPAPPAPPPSTADLSVSVARIGVPSPIGIAPEVKWVVSVANAGPAAAGGALLAVPAAATVTGLPITCAATSGAQCPPGLTGAQVASGVSIPALPPGSSVALTIVYSNFVYTNGSPLTGVLVFPAVHASVTVPSGLSDPTPANNTTLLTSADLSVSVARIGVPTPIGIAPDVKWVVSVANAGPAAAGGALLAVPAAATVTDRPITCAATSGAQCPPGLTGAQVASAVSIPALPPGSSVALTIVYSNFVYTNGSPLTGVLVYPAVRASVTVPSGLSDPMPANNSAPNP